MTSQQRWYFLLLCYFNNKINFLFSCEIRSWSLRFRQFDVCQVNTAQSNTLVHSVLTNKWAKFGAKIFRHFWDIGIFVLGYFILPHPVYWRRKPAMQTAGVTDVDVCSAQCTPKNSSTQLNWGVQFSHVDLALRASTVLFWYRCRFSETRWRSPDLVLLRPWQFDLSKFANAYTCDKIELLRRLIIHRTHKAHIHFLKASNTLPPNSWGHTKFEIASKAAEISRVS